MKKILSVFPVLLLLSGCQVDNYQPPTSLLSGSVTYDGRAIYLAHGDVKFNLYQDGYEKQGPVTVTVSEDGTFSALVYDGSYHLCNIDDAAPWSNDVEPVDIVVSGDTFCNVEVKPYFTIDDAAIALDGTTVKGLCGVKRVSEGRNAKSIFLAVGKTRFINDQSYSYLARKSVTGVRVNGSHSFSVDISEFMDGCDCLYARIGLEIEGTGKYIYSETIRIK